MNYGVKSKVELTDMIKRVVSIFGGGVSAVRLLAGTCAAETHYGKYPDDNPHSLGVGVAQCDEIGLQDVKMHIRNKDRASLLELGYDIDTVKLSDLAYDPLLAVCIMRIFYKRKVEPLPTQNDITGMGEYWKTHYNTNHHNAKGTVGKFIVNYYKHAPIDFL